ncbi:PAS domain S-box-containing protein [Sphingomonas sp. SORGH_AS 950]|uniref:PAS domain S-box protein n=1 Tax=Sphingomonas sp. SORGH_AS_0950 TaxID=3041792 RepID=UPI00278B510C|nr:PAS domain S-box protein [Sphingomonas sp. SORGH_AS_0950]MDQ1156009.1 PAS domain S-box-containing protein [Sphingomonas sp. SORGH_AS_0950]
MPKIKEMMKRQQVLADFGDFAIRSEDLDAVLTEACRLVAKALGTDRAKVLEIQEERQQLFVQAGVGWAKDVVGHVHLSMTEASSETYSINAGEPVVSQDITKEDRFIIPAFMKEAGVVALVNVPILVPGRRPYGVLQVDATGPRTFGDDEIQFLRTYAAILGPVIDRLRKVDRLHASEERFRRIVETVQDYAIFTTDAKDRIDNWFPGAEAVFGWTADEAVGQLGSIAFTPEDRAAGEDKREIETARRDGYAANIRWHLRKDERRIFIEGAVWALLDEGGTARGFVKVGQDVTQRKRAETALRESEERLRSAVEVGQLGLWDWNVITGEVHWSDEHFRMEGYDVGEVTPSYEAWSSRIHPEDRARTEAALHQAMERQEEFVHEFRVVHPDHSVHWLSGRGKFDHDAAGRPVRMVGAVVETTDRREWKERQQILVKELQHRTFNLMGMVRSMADATIRSSVDLKDFRAKFRDRIEALARAQRLLSQLRDDDRVTFGDLIQAELDATGALDAARPRVTLDGPHDVPLRSGTVQTFAMALHELTTNAVKYGALSQPGAHLAVRWRVEDGANGEPWLHVDWRESGVNMPPDGQAPGGTGQGRTLIEKALPYQLQAETTYVMAADGIHCSIALPVSNRSPLESRDASHQSPDPDR